MMEKIKNATLKELELIAEETRREIIDVISKNGGHLASSLGTVELTLALLKVFNPPQDKIIWDVGHQAYPYKILTDRKNDFATIRQKGGISGFPKMTESIYDSFGAGHGGTSISAALGIETALRIRKDDSKVIAIIGDGSMTSGLAFEAMNQISPDKNGFITVLNDNDMFISTSVGSLSSWFSRKLTGKRYNSIRQEIKSVIMKLPPIFRGEYILEIIRKALESSKSLMTPGILFEGLGYQYVGPIDGHNIKELEETFKDVSQTDGPVLVHIHTKKGKGYLPAEENPCDFHGVAPFKKDTGEPKAKSHPSFTGYLSNYLPSLFRRNSELIAITAAMPDGTGLKKLQEQMSARVFDVGMAEGHAVTYAAGLAAGGLKPLVCIYSTFLQRAFDNIIHDVALQNLPVIFLIDRAGVVGEDGPTHHGLFDISYMRMIPNMTVMAPRNEQEMARMIELAITMETPAAIRYPRGSGVGKRFYNRLSPVHYGEGIVLRKSESKTLIISVGNMDIQALDAASILAKEGIFVSIFDLSFIKPLPENLFSFITDNEIDKIITIEDGIKAGGAGSAILEEINERKISAEIKTIAIRDTFPGIGTQEELRHESSITSRQIVDAVRKMEK